MVRRGSMRPCAARFSRRVFSRSSGSAERRERAASPRRSRRSVICAKSLRCRISRARDGEPRVDLDLGLFSPAAARRRSASRTRVSAGPRLLLLRRLRRRDRREHGDHLVDQPALPPEKLERRRGRRRDARASSRRRNAASSRNRRASRCRPSSTARMASITAAGPTGRPAFRSARAKIDDVVGDAAGAFLARVVAARWP